MPTLTPAVLVVSGLQILHGSYQNTAKNSQRIAPPMICCRLAPIHRRTFIHVCVVCIGVKLMQIPLTPIALTALANVALAGLFAVIPPWRAKFVKLSADEQTAIFGLFSIGLGVVLMIGTCAGLLTGVACAAQDLTTYFVGVVLASIGGMRAASAAFIGVRLTDRRERSDETTGQRVGIPHAGRAKMLDS